MRKHGKLFELGDVQLLRKITDFNNLHINIKAAILFKSFIGIIREIQHNATETM